MAMSVCRTLHVEKVKKSIRKMDYGILGTIDNNGCTSSNKRFVWGFFSFDEICIVIPILHHILRFVPPNCIQFQGTAELLSINDKMEKIAFQKNRVLENDP